MNLKQLIEAPEKYIKNSFMIGFAGTSYPLLFLKKIRDYIQLQCGLKMLYIHMQDAELAQIRAQLEMSFLGHQNIYWLGDLSTLSLKNYMQWMTYLSNYKGPHSILFFTTKEFSDKNMKLISLPEQIDYIFFKDLLSLWSPEDRERLRYTAELIFKKVGVLSLDHVMQMVEYAQVLGSARSSFLNDWLTSIIKPESSLFNLSGALFAGDKRSFLKQWRQLQKDYEFPFWMSYFSEQFFRAYYYISCKKNNNHIEARKIGFRLPFSFLQKDWKKWEQSIFQDAHQRIVDIDFNLKNGGSEIMLEQVFLLFYT